MDDRGNTNGNDFNNMKYDYYTPGRSYYTENYKKKSYRKSGIFQLVLVAVIGAILGGVVTLGGFTLLAPALNQNISGSVTGNTATGNNAFNGGYKKIEITGMTDSPVTAIAEKVSPSVVGIKVTYESYGGSFFFGSGEGVSEGSGIIIREDGYILTNNHVISRALNSNSNTISSRAKIEIILPSDMDKLYTATVVGRDIDSDLAVLKINAKGLPAAELGNSDELKVGELAVAIGNPGGLNYMGSVTAGVISGLNRTITTEDGRTLTLIQTDAAINPGNSGGALCNSKGEVIGINTIKISSTDIEGLGFAIPSNYAKTISESLIEYKYVKGRPYLGIQIDPTFTEQKAKLYNVPAGLLVYDVTPLSAAYKAGIHPGDIITKFNGVQVRTFSELETEKKKYKPGDSVKIEIYRDGSYKTLTVILDEDKN